jgi:uncharacterized membrane protein
MHVLIIVGVLLIVAGIWLWARKASWWDDFVARLWALAGNSRTLAVAYAAELLGMLDEAKLVDWSQLVGSQNAGRVLVIMGIVMIVLRMITRTAVEFRPKG